MNFNKKKTISSFDDKIKIDLPLDLKVPKDYLKDEDYKLITQIYSVINKYKSSSWLDTISFVEMQSDVIYLQSLQATLSFTLSHLISYSDSIEEQIKIARSKVRVQTKNIKQEFEDNGESVSVTIDDMKDLSYTKTEDIWKKLQDSKIAADLIKFIYYAVKDHVAMLDRAITRIARFE
jgi:hypothetical protein